MVQTIAIGNLSLPELEEKQNLQLADEPGFFPEWHQDLPRLLDDERQLIDHVQQGYFDQIRNRQISEGLIKLVIVSPLLYLAGFYRRPFEVKLEESVELTLEDGSEVWRGRIDALVIQEQLWVLVVESKASAFGVDAALPQALGYMLTNPNPARPTYGLITNGGSFLFLKLVHAPQPRYAVSDVLLLLPGRNCLYQVLQVLKAIGQNL